MSDTVAGEKRVAVETGRPYEVIVGAGLLDRVGQFVTEPAVALVSDSDVAPLHAVGVREALEAGGAGVLAVTLPAGEASKSLSEFETLVREMASAGLKRDCAIVAVGGGVVSDLAGFAAASYLRGVAFYACPTSLLAMVDASVGGKTGVNLPEGKNLVGAFWQPRAVLADVNALATLPEPVFREGAVELFKHGLLADEWLLGAIDETGFGPAGDAEVLAEYIYRSVLVKARIVSGDERESGKRAHLNLGHNLAHALEAASSHRLRHGEAVAYGLLFSALLAQARGWYDFVSPARNLLEWLQPAPLPNRELTDLQPYLERDKKNLGERQRFVLMRAKETPVVVDDVQPGELESAWRRLLEVVS
ncbi:MAG TPA: 3-dehydroquinate synthase [Trueperaceae bacterium]